MVGTTVGQAYTRVYMLERAAQAQILAMSTGLPLLSLSEAELETFTTEWVPVDSGATSTSAGEQHFKAMKRILDREQPDYRD